LDAVSALTVEHVSVEPGLDRRLHVQGVVDTDARRHNIRDALTGLPSRLVSVELITLAEEAQRPARSHAQSPTIVHATELTRDRVPAFDDVRRYVTQRARTASDPTAVSEADESIDDAVRRFSTAMLSRSLQARLHARAVLDLVNRVPSSEVERLSARARSSWRELIQRHADSCRHETATLREDLERVFSPDPAPEQGS